MLRLPPSSTLFPYTTLFRSAQTQPQTQTAPAAQSQTTTTAPAARSGTAATTRSDVNVRATVGTGSSRTVVRDRSEEHTSELQSQSNLVCRLLLEKKKKNNTN